MAEAMTTPDQPLDRTADAPDALDILRTSVAPATLAEVGTGEGAPEPVARLAEARCDTVSNACSSLANLRDMMSAPVMAPAMA